MRKSRIFSSVLIAVVLMLAAAVVWKTYQKKIVLPAFSSKLISDLRDPELVRMEQALDFYKTVDMKVRLDGNEYSPAEMAAKVRLLLRLKFKPGMKAEDWIAKYAYRGDAGEIIYFLYPDGKNEIAKYALLKKLQELDSQKS